VAGVDEPADEHVPITERPRTPKSENKEGIEMKNSSASEAAGSRFRLKSMRGSKGT
jgi:hypothetical protein